MALRTIQQFQKTEGLSRYQVDALIRSGLEYIMVGSRKMIPDGAWERFLAENTVKSCQEETTAPAFAGSTSEALSTSSGLRTVAAGSAARARQIGNKLKSRSRSSSTDGSDELGRVIPMRCS
jgi:hypothetical protein